MTQTWFRLQHHSRTETILDPATWQSSCWDAKYVPCPCCDGRDHGDVEDIRHGVSVCADLADLIDYTTEHEVEHAASYIDQLVLIELAGALSDDDDHDAADGAYLLLPERIVSVQPVTGDLRDAIEYQE
jgi:hypothetical protein